ncbi:unnamed protein product [Dicrocoelium dendriticum]|nr:unnamed protein product [Dicrocoelium dendriticum]
MRSFELHYLPIVFCLLMLAAFITSYSLSAELGHASALFPYISDTGSMVPESCVFGQLLNLCAFIGTLCVYCWYSHQMERFEALGSPRSHIIHARVHLVSGLLSALGLSIVANFQESSLLVVHMVGALVTFTFGVVYCILMSHASRAHLNSLRWLWVLRTVLAVVSALAFILTFVFAGIAERNQKLPHKWDPNEELYTYHALGTTCEWLLAFCFLAIFITMIYELRDYALDPVKVMF